MVDKKSIKKAAEKKESSKKINIKKGPTKKEAEKEDLFSEEQSEKSISAKKLSEKKARIKKTESVSERSPKIEPSATVPIPQEISSFTPPPVAKSPEIPPSAPSAPSPSGPVYTPWQDRYIDDRIVLMIRDPYWCFVYWDLSSERQAQAIREIQKASGQTKFILRVFDVTAVEFDGANAHRFMDIEITEEASNWYINVWAADRSYCVDLGLRDKTGNFTTLLRSNIVTTPRDSVSPVIDEEWMVVDETFDQLYKTAGADELGRSSEAVVKYMLKRVRADVTSGGLASMGSEGGRPPIYRSEDFWLNVHTELIVYGATEPDAQVTIQDHALKLNTDGTFSVRYALPEGKQVIPVKAVNAAGTQERIITPIVEKRTE